MPESSLDYFTPQHHRRPVHWPRLGRFAKFAGILVLLEIGGAILAYHTLGFAESVFCFILVLANVVPWAISSASERVGGAIMVFFALLIVPYQAFLGVRWIRVHAEAQRIVDYVEARRLSTGQYPPDLRGYSFRDDGTREFIQYDGAWRGALGPTYRVSYHIGSTATLHWYVQGGGWAYFQN